MKQSQASFSLPYKNLVVFGLAVILCLGYADAAFAYSFSILCTGFITPNMVGAPGTPGIGPAVASVGVIMLGVGASLGKVSWGMAVMVAVGIAVMFGYSAIIGALGGVSC